MPQYLPLTIPPLNCDVYLLYAYVAAVSAVIIAIVLNRIRSTVYKETVDGSLCRLLAFLIAFCAVDAVWGVIGMLSMRTLYVVSTYGFHVMAAAASFVISEYVIRNLDLSPKTRTGIQIFRFVLLALQVALLVQNAFTGYFFVIDENAAYHSGILRPIAFYLQFLHYLSIIVYIVIRRISGTVTSEKIYVFRSSLIFAILPLLFGFLQMLYPDGSFYSLGFLITSVTMYAFNITKQRESYLAAYYIAEESEKSRQEIEKSLRIAEEANKAKTVFLSNMSHDIRTPINGIMGMITLIKKEPLSDRVAEYVEKIDGASSHLLSLVNDVLDMSRIESERTTIARDPTDVRVIFDGCASIILGQMEGKTIDFVRDSERITHTGVFADSLHVRQILINILGNAVKFTPDGGTVRFTLEEKEFDGKTVRFAFTVKDTGIGMKPEFISHIFEPFAQENNNGRTHYQGTGLGMSITKKLVELMGGTISVESEYGKGSTFTVEIPMEYNPEGAPKTVPADEIETSLKGLRVLLVEDNELNMEIAASLLSDEGAVITQAFNGKEAVDKFLSAPPDTFDVILMDLMMPVMNGLEATRAIRADERPDAKTIPILAMTANAFEEDRKQAIEAGMNAHIAKPIDFPILINTISRFIKH